MARSTDNTNLDGPNRKALAAGILLLLLVLLVAVADSIGGGLILLGLAAFAIGAYALVRGRATWVHIASRRMGAVALAVGFAIMMFGGAVSPSTQNTASEAAAPSSSSAPSTTRPAPTSTSSAPVAQPIAPVTTTQAPPPPPPPPPPPAPVMAMTCPAGGSVASPVFGQRITATAPYSVTIDYGDGDRYTNDDQHLSAIFSHRYQFAGNFAVDAVLTDATGQTTSASCAYNWTKPVPVAPSGGSGGSAGGSGSSGHSGGGSSGDTYVNVDGNVVQAPVEAPSAPAGATAHCKDGTWSFSQHRSGTCSGHGGVADWL